MTIFHIELNWFSFLVVIGHFSGLLPRTSSKVHLNLIYHLLLFINIKLNNKVRVIEFPFSTNHRVKAKSICCTDYLTIIMLLHLTIN